MAGIDAGDAEPVEGLAEAGRGQCICRLKVLQRSVPVVVPPLRDPHVQLHLGAVGAHLVAPKTCSCDKDCSQHGSHASLLSSSLAKDSICALPSAVVHLHEAAHLHSVLDSFSKYIGGNTVW